MATIIPITEGNLLIASVTGELNAEEVIAVIREYYPNGIVKDVIWDLSHATLQSISRYNFEAIAKATKEAIACGSRQGGKTVFVGNVTSDYELLQMYTAIAEIADIRIDYNVFKTIEEARSWLK